MPEIDLPMRGLNETTLLLPESGDGIARLARRYPVKQGPDGEALFHSVELETQILDLTDPPHTLPPTHADQRQRVLSTDPGVFAVTWTERHRSNNHRDIENLHVHRLAAGAENADE